MLHCMLSFKAWHTTSQICAGHHLEADAYQHSFIHSWQCLAGLHYLCKLASPHSLPGQLHGCCLHILQQHPLIQLCLALHVVWLRPIFRCTPHPLKLSCTTFAHSSCLTSLLERVAQKSYTPFAYSCHSSCIRAVAPLITLTICIALHMMLSGRFQAYLGCPQRCRQGTS